MSEHFWHNRRVLITGVNGFLGAWLAQALVERGAQVFGLVAPWSCMMVFPAE